MDGERLERCPLRPYKDNPFLFSELFKLYNFREKGILPDDGAYYDQANAYVELMLEMDSAIADRMDVKETYTKERNKQEDQKLDNIRALILNKDEKK